MTQQSASPTPSVLEPPSALATWTSTALVRIVSAGAVVVLDLERLVTRVRR